MINKFSKTLSVLLLMLLFLNSKHTYAQESKLIINDYYAEENIQCYNFNKIQFSFPINDQILNGDAVIFRLLISNNDTSLQNSFKYERYLLKKDIAANYSDKQIGVITIWDANHQYKTPFYDVFGPLLKEEFYKLVGRAKIEFKPMQFEAISVDIVGYDEIYDEYSNSVTKLPIYGNEKVICRNKIRFFNLIYNAKIKRDNSQYAIYSLIHMFSKKKEKEEENYMQDCEMKYFGKANVIMNTTINIDTFFGYIEN